MQNSVIDKFLAFLNLTHIKDVSEINLIRMRMTMRVCYISFIFGVAYSVFLWYCDLASHIAVCLSNSIGFLIVAHFVSKNKFETAKILHTINACWGIFAFASFLGKESGVHLFILLSPIFVLSLYDLRERLKIVISILMYIITFLLYLKYDINPIFPKIHNSMITPDVISLFYIVNIIFIIILSTLLVAYILTLNTNFLIEIIQKNKTLSSTQKMLSNEVTIRKESEEQIQTMYEELQISYERLNHFNQMVSHNLRSPIANLIGLSHLIEDETIDESERKMLMSNIKKTATKLDEVIKDMNQILTINKDINEVKDYVDLESALNKVLESEGKILEEIDARLEVDFSKANGLVSVSSFIHSIFHNLMSNAIKYRQRDRKLIIKLESNIIDDVFQITFSDNGMGIDLTDNHNKVFKPYSRFHSNIDGKGIGLYLVQAQIQMLGGKISVDSQQGVGTKFTITIKI